MPDPGLSLLLAGVIAMLTAVFLWPERGLLPRWQTARRLTRRVRGEDALKHLINCETAGRRPTIESIAGALHVSTNDAVALAHELQAQQLLQLDGGDIRLTPAGRNSALHIIRAHRLWERYLADETGYGAADWHEQAEALEHRLTPAQLDALAAQLNFPTHDPHGDPIPGADGSLVAHGGRPLPALPPNTPGQIVHLEDEPAVVYAQLVAEGLHVGMPVRVVEQTPERIRFWANGDEHVLAPLVAANISVVPRPAAEPAIPTDCSCLADVPIGASAEVVALSPACRGVERRRFLDLGILPGTIIRAEMRSPGGDPTAYAIRGALIALRRQQAETIKVRLKETYDT